eukprot:9384163-Lingulodinium_polyedra.AAC.1
MKDLIPTQRVEKIMQRVQRRPPKQYAGRHDYTDTVKYQIDWANQSAKEGRRWRANHFLNGVMGWRPADLPRAQIMEYDDVVRMWGLSKLTIASVVRS